MTDHPNTDPACLVPAGRPAEAGECPACSGSGIADERDRLCDCVRWLPIGAPPNPECHWCKGTGRPWGVPQCTACGGTGKAPAEEAVLEVVEEPRPADVPCAHCGTLCSPDMPYCSAECLRLAEGPEPLSAVQCHHCRQQTPVGPHPALCHFCGKRLDWDVTEYDPESSDLLDSVSPGESLALVQEVEARTDFRQAAKLESERCDKMARDLAELRDRMKKELKLVERQHAKYASRADLLRRYLLDDEPVPF